MKVFNALSHGEKRLVLWIHRAGDDYIRAIFGLIEQADRSLNDERLGQVAKAYPEEVTAYLKYTREEGWWDDLKAKLFSEAA